MLEIGLFGVGHLGKIHLRLLKELNTLYKIVGVHDNNLDYGKQIAHEFQIPFFENPNELINQSDCLDVVTPTISHFELAYKIISANKHVFIEKPITQTIEEAEKLIQLNKKNQIKVQVGHVERFNPAFVKAMPYFKNPMFIETHRLAQFNPRGTDVPVVLDLMIHDLDVILSVVDSEVENISASGVAVVSDSDDIANARIVFKNGCVANLTSSRISLKNMRKSRFFQKDAYISVDFLTKELEVFRLENIEGEPDPFDIVFDLGENKTKKKVLFDKPDIFDFNAIKEELISFHDSIVNNNAPKVNIFDASKALTLAYQILDNIQKAKPLL
ncbi:MAG: Gfo/Idh/MocA family oxidoreductase [Flavobacteriia bacterium]|nr:Gfo/Idh/MocA family oxidoreductase [Flavobacteriia bacterium]